MSLWTYLNGKSKNQIIAVLCANLGIYCVGTTIGWFSPAIPILTSDDTPISSGRITVAQVSILGGIFSLSASFSGIFFAVLDRYIGLKKSLWITAIPGILCWVFIIVTKEVEYLYVSRILGGILAGGTFYALPLYVAEISDNDIRGRLGSILPIMHNIGLLIAYIIGSYASYTLAACLAIIGPIVFACSLFMIPDTPKYLLSQGRIEAAEKSLMFYKNCRKNSRENWNRYKSELDKLQEFVDSDKYKEKLRAGDFCTPAARFGFLIGIFMVLLDVFHGSLILNSYASTVFSESGSNMDALVSSIIVQLIELVGAIGALFLIDRIGRRVLLIISTFGTAFGFIVVGIYSFMAVKGFDVNIVNWIPVICLSISIFCASIGILPISLVILVESLPSKIRSEGTLICVMLLHLAMATGNTTFPILTDTFELYVSMWTFGGVCILGLLYAIFIVKDTTGKDLLKN